MKIDNRVFIIPAMPFAVLAMIRLLWWVAGANWSNPEVAAALCLVLGFFGGVFLTGFLFIEEIEIGHLRIGREKD